MKRSRRYTYIDNTLWEIRRGNLSLWERLKLAWRIAFGKKW